ncbi:MAG: hypothetical protein CSA81_12680 [Acidobacteria bacterium]|nr:MAG: hypothetical protein CSA81_12680 [Acidobacteriota bacterium]
MIGGAFEVLNTIHESINPYSAVPFNPYIRVNSCSFVVKNIRVHLCPSVVKKKETTDEHR